MATKLFLFLFKITREKVLFFSIKCFKFANRIGFLLFARHSSKDFALALSVGCPHIINCISWKEMITCTIKKR